MACTNLFCKYFATRSQCFSVIVQCWNIQLFPFYKNKERLKKKYERESVTWVLKKEMNSWGDYSSKAREGYYIRPIFVISIVFLYLGLTFRQFKSLAQTLLCFQKPSCTKRKMSWLYKHVKDTSNEPNWGWNSWKEWKTQKFDKKKTANLQIPKNWYMNTTYVSKIGQKNNEIYITLYQNH